jgi:hypothetical protein
MPNSFAMKAALARLQYWRDQLNDASAAGNILRMEECAEFIDSYEGLIASMSEQIGFPEQSQRNDNDQNHLNEPAA